ncbi:MAG: transcriptional repressor NrdR [Candidatus Blackburnbacteria bacterium]|nr:transcriptional repressor NrdR [Candidatus Blackburnbacteria bacterium]
MKCPFCQAPTGVVESRSSEEGDSIRRRRFCNKCGKRFTTHERVSGPTLWVVKKDGKREPFNREKVRLGILKAVEKRSVTIEAVDEAVDEVERELLRKQKEEVSSKVIGNAVLKRLRKIDNVAWLRFASVYLEFEDLSDFEKALKHAQIKSEN